MKKKLLAGLLLSLLLVWFSLRGIDPVEVYIELQKTDYLFVAGSMIVIVLTQIMRVIRWNLFLKPLENIDPYTIFSVSNVGFLAIVAIPARLGELVKPYLITKKSHIPMGSAIATVFAERMLDITPLLIIAAIVFGVNPLPPWLFRSGLIFVAVMTGMLSFLALIFIRKEKAKAILAWITNPLPERYAILLNQLVDHFIKGFSGVKDRTLLSITVAISAAIWLANAAAIYLFFLAFHFNLPLTAAFVLMIVLILGIAIPSAPGFIGNWHYACILGLGIFNVTKTSALSFALLYHAISIGVIIVLGLISLPSNSSFILDLWYRKNT